jgi:hypothetical protein
MSKEEQMMRSVIVIAAFGLTIPAWGAELPKSGTFQNPSGFKSVDETIQVAEGHALSHGISWGVVTADTPLRLQTAMCPYIGEMIGDTISLNGRCAWKDIDGDEIFTEWTAKFSVSGKSGEGPQTITGGSGKFRGIQGTSPFQCQIVGDMGQFRCTQQWTYRLP